MTLLALLKGARGAARLLTELEAGQISEDEARRRLADVGRQTLEEAIPDDGMKAELRRVLTDAARDASGGGVG